MRRRLWAFALLCASIFVLGALPRSREALDAWAAPPLAPAAGRLLMARIGMGDRRFNRTVLLITSHGAGGSDALILNRPPSESSTERRAYGGPVRFPEATTWLVFAAAGPEGATAVLPSVWVLPDAPVDAELASPRRAFAGFTGWFPGQLQAEVDRRDWVVVQATAAHLFHPAPETLWAELASERLREAVR